MGKPFIDRTGFTYGNLTAQEYVGIPEGKTKPAWKCSCVCGSEVIVTSSNLSTGHTTSCGCTHKEIMRQRRIYPLELEAEYKIWRGIKQRTSKKAGKNTAWYSGIALSEEWENSFEQFFADLGPRPSPKHSIERLDVTKGYYKENCVWATAKTQANNRTSNVVLTLGDQTLTIAQWAAIVPLSQSTIAARIRRGWSDEDALTLPLNTRKSNGTE